ncbi:hypothetical protein TNCV_190411 [Trichonephila clavipes]|nr:hypothetical protein TNCV_190411 [Trichonephila clavipes]
MSMALEYAVSPFYAYIIDLWRNQVYNGTIKRISSKGSPIRKCPGGRARISAGSLESETRGLELMHASIWHNIVDSSSKLRRCPLQVLKRCLLANLIEDSQRPPVAAVAEWYGYRTMAYLVTSSSPVPLKTRRLALEFNKLCVQYAAHVFLILTVPFIEAKNGWSYLRENQKSLLQELRDKSGEIRCDESNKAGGMLKPTALWDFFGQKN